MPEESRALRNCADDVTHALQQLRAWRADGCADKICHWSRRLDLLLGRWVELRKEEQDSCPTTSSL